MKERRGGKREERYENIRRINEGVGRASRQSIRTYRFRWWFFFSQLQVKELLFLSGVGASKHSVPRSTP